jgi:signal transduction histidine kinase
MQPTEPKRRVYVSSVYWLLALFGVSAAVLFALLYGLTGRYLVHEVDERLDGEVAEFQSISRADAIATIGALSRREVAGTRPYGLFDKNGAWLAGNITKLPAVRDGKPFNYTAPMWEHRRWESEPFRGIVVPTTSGLRIVVGHATGQISQFDRTLLKTLGAGLAITIVLAACCGAALNAVSNRHIREISETSREIMAGQLGRRLRTRGYNRDLDRLAVIVNTMLGEIERLVAEVQGVCAGIAHELRTPMTHLRAGLERARRRSNTLEGYEQAVDAAIAESDAVLSRFAALLRIAEIDARGRQASFGEVALDTVLRDVAELYEPMAEHRGLSMTLHASAPVCVNGDVDLLFGAIENLLDNALKFTPRGGAITLETGIDAGSPTLKITDTGPGIEIGEREAVLRPFYRGGGAKSGETRGHGLGLSLVAAIARVHGARVEIHDNRPGCQVLLRFAAR